MGTGKLKRRFVSFGAGLIVISILAGCASTHVESLIFDRLSSESTIYYDNGVAAADSVYKSALPFFAGYATGMVAPVPFVFSPAIIFGGGMLGAAVAIAGGNAVIESNTITTPAELTDGFSELHRESFDRGYSERVKELRKSRYGFGVVAGVVTDIAYTVWLFRNFQGFGGV